LPSQRRKPYLPEPVEEDDGTAKKVAADLAANLRWHRASRSITTRELAKRSGLEHADILHLESGDIGVGRMLISELFPKLKRIGTALDVRCADLFEENRRRREDQLKKPSP
jgi:hypothetical protein